jgi:hypothetical protein
MTVAALASALVFCLSALAVDARITTAKIRKDDRPGILLSESFGFGGEGDLSFRLSNVRVHVPTSFEKSSYEHIGFYLSHRGDEIADYPSFTDESHLCKIIEDKRVSSLVNFGNPSIQDMIKDHVVNGQPVKIFNYTVNSQLMGNGGKDALFFVNCASPTMPLVSFDIQVEMSNQVNGHKSYLSVGELELPTTYLVRPPFLCSGCTIQVTTCERIRLARNL